MGGIFSCQEGSPLHTCCQPCVECSQGIKGGCAVCFQSCEACGDCCLSCFSCCGTVFGCIAASNVNLGNIFLIKDRSDSDIQKVLSEFTFKGKSVDKQLGEVELLEHNYSKEVVILKQIENFIESKFNTEYERQEKRKELQHPNIIQLRYLTKQSEYGFCFKNFKGYLFYDYILTDLAQDFEFRLEKGLDYTEEDVWKIVEGSINGLRFLYDKGIQHGSIRMSTIYLTQQDSIKVADPGLYKYKNGYSMIFEDTDRYAQTILLSPELLNAIDRRQSDPVFDREKADVFALAMVFLQVGSMRHSSNCYDYDQACIYEDRLLSKYYISLDSIKKNYHDSLYYLIQDMLQPKPELRPTFSQLADRLDKIPKLKKYQQNLTETVIAPRQAGDPIPNYPVVSIYADTSKVGQPDYYQPDAPPENLDYPMNEYGYGMSLMNEPNLRQTRVQVEQVKEKYQNGSKYVGSKRGAMKHGQGKFINQDGSYYDGQWKDNKMGGKGQLYVAGGQMVYDGKFKDDKYHGFGVEYNQNKMPMINELDLSNLNNIEYCWSKYEGEFKNDGIRIKELYIIIERDGFGTLTLSNGGKFSGNWKNGLVNGIGTYINKKGDKVQGEWVKGIKK